MKFIASFIAALACVASFADTVYNPDYEWCASKCYTISSIERTPDSTVFNMRARWKPHYWIEFDSTTVVVDRATGKRYEPIGSHGITLGKRLWMPDEGEVEISIVYPPLPPETSVIDFDPDFAKITGLHIDGTKATKSGEVNADAWLAENAKPYPGVPDNFYTHGTTKLSGVINGYTPAMGVDNMIVYASDAVTGKNTPITVPINEDGSFVALIPVSRPGLCTLSGPCHTIAELYVEPGRDLALYIDWEELTEYEINRILDLPLNPFILHYGGSLGDINRRLAEAPQKESVGYSLNRDYTPSRAAAKLDSINKAYGRAVEKYISKNEVDKHSARLLRNMVKAHYLNEILDYELYRSDLIYRKDSLAPSLQEPVTADYFMPMKDVITDKDEWMLASMPSILFNRINYCGLFDLDTTEQVNDEAHRLIRKTNFLKAFAGIDHSPLMWQETLSSQELCQTRGMEKDSLTMVKELGTLNRLEQSGVIDHPFILSSVDTFLNDYFSRKSYPLPDTEAGQLVKSIIAPHLGKYVLIDFWGTSCGPCRSNIEAQAETRHRNHDNPDIKFIFITGESESPRSNYDSYVAKHLAGEESHYLSARDYRRMRELFGFNGIPRYVLVGPDCTIVDDNFVCYNLKHTLEQNGKTLR